MRVIAGLGNSWFTYWGWASLRRVFLKSDGVERVWSFGLCWELIFVSISSRNLCPWRFLVRGFRCSLVCVAGRFE